NTYATDDYFAILSDGGAMLNTDLLNIAIGRLTVSTQQEAMDVVRKIKHYQKIDTLNNTIGCSINSSNSVLGDWRNKVVLVSDDEDNNAYFNDIEIMASKIEQTKPTANINKIHADAYAQQSTAVGERIPAAESAIEERVNDGSLIVNYIGHGGETGWAHEQILTVPTIQNWSNLSSMPVFMTATCEFGRFDDHDRVSAGEFVLLNPNGGGVGLYTTTRLVYATPNEWLNRYFYDTVFDLVDYKAQRLGDIYKGTKNKFAMYSADQNYRKFALLGDPALKLALPEIHVIIDSLSSDTIKALSELKVFGHIEDQYQNIYNNYNGKVYLTFFDKKTTFNTLGTNSGSSSSPFQMWKNVIYKGKSTVNSGNFSFSLKVPKDIDYTYGNSRMSFYVENGNIDGNGSYESLIIGGINANAPNDITGPEINLFLNDENFVSGGISNNNPVLIAHLFDTNGINTVGNGIGHDIELIIDGDNSSSIILNDYYESDLDTYQSGKIFFELSELSPGGHTVELKVWDNYNNSSKSDINFIVVNNEEVELSHVLNYPNPFTTNTSFFFEHNQNCNFLDVNINVYSVSGKIVKTINQRIHNEGFRSNGINWDGRDEFGEQLAKGVYLYKLKVTNEQGMSSSKTETMFLLK
ncbi:MAG: oxidoreductase, partial [Crocinitomicaceae bacterium]|nr:oxidoreductase [Crocinitomicaceae bacterium]